MSLWNWIGRNPLEAAALTAGVVGTGGALASAMAPAAAAGSGLTLGGAGAAAGMGGGTGLLAGAPAAGMTGALPALGASTASSGSTFAAMQPYMQAISTASQVKGLLSDNTPQMPAPQVQQGNPAGAQTLAQLYQQGMQMTPEDQARLQRKTMWG